MRRGAYLSVAPFSVVYPYALRLDGISCARDMWARGKVWETQAPPRAARPVHVASHKKRGSRNKVACRSDDRRQALAAMGAAAWSAARAQHARARAFVSNAEEESSHKMGPQTSFQRFKKGVLGRPGSKALGRLAGRAGRGSFLRFKKRASNRQERRRSSHAAYPE